MEIVLSKNKEYSVIVKELSYIEAGDRNNETSIVQYAIKNDITGAISVFDIVSAPGKISDSDFLFYSVVWHADQKISWKRDWLHGYVEVGPIIGKIPRRETREMVFDFTSGNSKILIVEESLEEIISESMYSFNELNYIFQYDFQADQLKIGKANTF